MIDKLIFNANEIQLCMGILAFVTVYIIGLCLVNGKHKHEGEEDY